MTTTLRFEMPSLHPAQQEAYDHPARFKMLVTGRRWGKTRLGVIKSYDKALRGLPCGWVSPTYSMSRVGWVPAVTIARSIPGAEIRLSDREIHLPGGGSISVRTGDNPDAARGLGWAYAVLDEAAYMRPETWSTTVQPALTDYEGGALFASTPRGFASWLYDLWSETQRFDDWAHFQYPSASNPYLSAKEIERLRLTMSSREFAQEILGEFVEGGGARYRAAWLDKTFWLTTDDDGWVQTIETSDGRSIPFADCARFATVDLATSVRSSADYTVIASVAAYDDLLFVLDIYRERIESPDLLPQIRRALERFDLSVAAIESAGFQLSVIQAARREGLPVEPVRADKDKVARSLTLEAYAENGRLYFLAEPDTETGALEPAEWVAECHRELLGFTGSDGAHDDQVDALAYAALRGQRLQGVSGPLGV